ncbi:hypothetical protein [Niallia taxi]|uniref:hypothetical protein n=1 Tax=Niallia taxi TaxID=2499688 RepID=UPI002E1EE888|nr:hypothetical protein [Niallia taxi]
MAKSIAKKKREKQLRETGFNVAIKRGDWGSINPMTKTTKTKLELLNSRAKKHKKNHSSGDLENGSFLFRIINQDKNSRQFIPCINVHMVPIGCEG